METINNITYQPLKIRHMSFHEYIEMVNEQRGCDGLPEIDISYMDYTIAIDDEYKQEEIEQQDYNQWVNDIDERFDYQNDSRRFYS